MKCSWRLVGEYMNLETYGLVVVGIVLIYTAQVSWGVTNPDDVAAINSLYVALGSPVLPGWIPNGGDPCAEAWQGILCNNTDIQTITLNGANLGGELGENLGLFATIKSIDLSSNHIGGNIPNNLPVTLQGLFLSANLFTGSIPITLASLPRLQAMSLNDNQLTGQIPDSFQTLVGLVNLDLSHNNLTGQLPPSMQSASSLTTLHLQDNQLSGTLDVIQDLPLRDVNIENNLFSGTIPQKLLSIPTFINNGNLFNSSIAPLAPSPISSFSPPAPPTFFGGPSSLKTPPPPAAKQVDGPSASKESKSGSKFLTTKRVVWISIAAVLFVVILALACVLCLPWFSRRKESERVSKQYGTGVYNGNRDNPRDNGSMMQPHNQLDKAPKEAVMRPKEHSHTETKRVEAIPRLRNEQEKNAQRMANIPKQDSLEIDMSGFDTVLMPPPPPPPPPPQPPVEKVIIRPNVATEVTAVKSPTKPILPPTSARSFTIASLQQYTNSFSQENLIGAGMLGSVYRAQLPDGKVLAIKKLDKTATSQQKDGEFIDLVNNIDSIRHPNVVELMGYCAEHGQRLLIYEYCSNGTLQDALHLDDELKRQLSWNARIRMALGAARALEYLHEVCHPPVVHRNFKSSNLLLDDDLAVYVSDCGLAPLISSGSVSRLSGQLLSAYGYGAPEFESGIYTSQSDVYSFGVVMLELLTGRKSHDRTRVRGEQFLVRWAIPQLHDIDALSRMVDPSLNGEYPAKSLSHFADIISRCVQAEPEFRPLMSEVVQDLQDMIRREPPPVIRSNGR